jgi:hypothetical protein
MFDRTSWARPRERVAGCFRHPDPRRSFGERPEIRADSRSNRQSVSRPQLPGSPEHAIELPNDRLAFG